MGYCIYQRESSFVIRKEHFSAFIAAAQEAYPHKFDSMSSVRDIFKYFAFSVDADEDGNLAGVRFISENSMEEERLFKLAAPYVDAGSYITFSADGDELFRYCFDGKSYRRVYPEVIWPKIHVSPREGLKRYKLPFSFVGELDIDADSEEEAQYKSMALTSKEVMSCICDLLWKDMRVHFHVSQIKEVEG